MDLEWRLWTDPWCGSAVWSDSFPSFFEVAVNKMSTVAEMWDQGTSNGSWNPRFVRTFNDWEVDLVVNLLRVLHRENVTSGEDKVSWIGATDDRLFVHATFKVLQPRVDSPFPAKGIWVPSVPTKSIFLRGKQPGGKCLL